MFRGKIKSKYALGSIKISEINKKHKYKYGYKMDKNMKEKTEKDIKEALRQFEDILREQIERCEKMKSLSEKPEGISERESEQGVLIGLIAGDGIGPVIMSDVSRVLRKLLAGEIREGKIELKDIRGLTLENRLSKGKTVPPEVLSEMRKCDVLLKGPTTTPSSDNRVTNLESANVFLRKEFDLFANIRPVKIPSLGIDWTFFRENTEGEYALGSSGIRIGDKFSLDFKVTSYEGTRRIAKSAFEYARKNDKKKVSVVTKANVMKKTDGDFLRICKEVASEYPEIEVDSWFVDIMAANLINEETRKNFEVIILPNLYGDIITDEAAEIQGGVGTAGSANIGTSYAIFEAIHGSAPRMVLDGLSDKANPSSLLRASVMMLEHIGYGEKARELEKAIYETDKVMGEKMTGLRDGATCREYADNLLMRI